MVTGNCLDHLILQCFKNCLIVFDGYPEEKTAQDHTYTYCFMTTGVGSDIQVDTSSRFDITKEKLVSEKHNKQNLSSPCFHSPSKRQDLRPIKAIHARNDEDS